MKKLNLLAIGAALCLAGCKTAEYKAAVKNDLRAPAYPLVTIDPYTSAWSTSDELYGSPVKHWTGRDVGSDQSRRRMLSFYGGGKNPDETVVETF